MEFAVLHEANPNSPPPAWCLTHQPFLEMGPARLTCGPNSPCPTFLRQVHRSCSELQAPWAIRRLKLRMGSRQRAPLRTNAPWTEPLFAPHEASAWLCRPTRAGRPRAYIERRALFAEHGRYDAVRGLALRRCDHDVGLTKAILWPPPTTRPDARMTRGPISSFGPKSGWDDALRIGVPSQSLHSAPRRSNSI